MLELKNISFTVSGEGKTTGILKDVSITLPDNQFVVVTGPNGGGKSTLARIIAGIETPSAGKILLNGEDITSLNVTERARRGIGYAFQQPVRFKGLTVLDLIRLAVGGPVSVSSACEYLSQVGLCARDYIRREVNASLSGGEMKRIEIATVIARKAPVSVFDEPEAGIDLWSFQNLIQVFERMHDEMHGVVLIISHQERILKIADEVIVLAGGEVTARGSREEILPVLFGDAGWPGGCKHWEGKENGRL